MAFESSPGRSGKTIRISKSRNRRNQRVLYAGVAAALGTVFASLWIALSSGGVNAPAVLASLPTGPGGRPQARLLADPRPTDPRRLVLDGKTSGPDAREVTQAWNRSRAAAALAAFERETEYAAVSPLIEQKQARIVRFGTVQDPRYSDVLRRAMAAAGTDKSERIAFMAPQGHGVTVRAAAGAALPQPEAMIEIAFAPALEPKTVQVAALEDARPRIPTLAAARSEEPASGAEDPFGQVLANGGAAGPALPAQGPLPLFKPRQTSAPPASEPLRMRAKSEPERAPNTLLAYARPQNPLKEDEEEDSSGFSLFGNRGKLPSPGRKIAVYDISAGIVHMPSGEKLEAHSGRGAMRDNPKFAHVRMRGPTPPNVYSLRMRESRFHGVEAIRMTPVNQSMMFGRDGILTHTYLLRSKRGDSSGCVAFADYARFLAAFKRGEVRTIVVVPRLAELPKFLAML